MALKRNKVELIGRLGRDPELRFTNTGQAVVNFSIATDEGYKDKDGKWLDRVEWHNCSAWGKLAEYIGNRIVKGVLVLVEGKLQTRKWQDKDGNDRYTTEVLVDTCIADSVSKSDGGQMSASQSGPRNSAMDQSQAQQGGAFTGMDDAPF